MTALNLVHANLKAGRYDYGRTWVKRRPAFLEYVRSVDPELITLTEAEAPACATLANLLDYGVTMYRGSAILWRPDRLRLTRTLERDELLAPPQTHSYVFAELELIGPRRLLNVGAVHLPPFATRAGLRVRQLAHVGSLTRKWADPTLVGIDANDKRVEKLTRGSFISAGTSTPAANRHHAGMRTSSATRGRQWTAGDPIDYVLGRNRLEFCSYEVVDGRRWSDHNALDVRVVV